MGRFVFSIITWLIFIGAALLEAGGDAVIRKGMRGINYWIIVAGGIMLTGYGILVNTIKWDFSRSLGVYVALFASVSILCGKFFFRDQVPFSTWVGLVFIIAGGLIIQFGNVR
jgi:drug/metabolite transporter superfamily protein YnfA